MANNVEMGIKLRKAREECGLSLKKLAELAEVDYSVLAHLERGNFGPTGKVGRRAWAVVNGIDPREYRAHVALITYAKHHQGEALKPCRCDGCDDMRKAVAEYLDKDHQHEWRRVNDKDEYCKGCGVKKPTEL